MHENALAEPAPAAPRLRVLINNQAWRRATRVHSPAKPAHPACTGPPAARPRLPPRVPPTRSPTHRLAGSNSAAALMKLCPHMEPPSGVGCAPVRTHTGVRDGAQLLRPGSCARWGSSEVGFDTARGCCETEPGALNLNWNCPAVAGVGTDEPAAAPKLNCSGPELAVGLQGLGRAAVVLAPLPPSAGKASAAVKRATTLAQRCALRSCRPLNISNRRSFFVASSMSATDISLRRTNFLSSGRMCSPYVMQTQSYESGQV